MISRELTSPMSYQSPPSQPEVEYIDDRPTDVEVENVDDHSIGEEPWDPQKTRVHTKHFSLRQIVEMIAGNEIDLAPDFQRQYVWKTRQRSSLIESLLLGIPLPSFYFNEDVSLKLQVVDGVQRLTTIFDFVKNREVTLGEVTYLKDFEGKGYFELDATFRRRIDQTQFVVHVIDPHTPYRVKFEIFRRINTGGSPLYPQEIRHCMSKDRSREFLKALANEPDFITATGGSFKSHPRMADREVVLRFLAFRICSPDEYAQHSSFDDFLGSVTERLDTDISEQELEKLHVDFIRSMKNSHVVFRDNAFRKWPREAERRYPINKALFESWSTVLADYSETTIKHNAEELAQHARQMMTDDQEFMSAISSSTGSTSNVRIRLAKVQDSVKGVLS